MKTIFKYAVPIILLLQTINVFAQENKITNVEPVCNCSIIFDELVDKIEKNYIAYHIEISEKRENEYSEQIKKFQLKAKNTTKEACAKVLKEFIEFYKDGHLYIGQFPKPTSEQIAQLSGNAEIINLDEDNVKTYLNKNLDNLDPIEGVWYANDSTKYAIVKNQTKHRYFVAILLSDKVENWNVGQVKAEFIKLNDGSYDVVYYDKNNYPTYPGAYTRGLKGGAAIRRDLILHMPPTSWGKCYPIHTEPLNRIDYREPRKPTFKIIDSDNILIAIPSHRPGFAETLKSFVQKHDNKIRNAKNLILDLRGNEGGSSGVTNVLLPYIETKEKEPEKYWVDDKMHVLSSKRNITYFKNAEKQGWAPKYLVKRLEENKDKVIPFADPIDAKETDGSPDSAETNQTKELSNPKNVAILMDGSIVSAGETFILNAMKNKKVTLFGQPTAGCIDYQSTYWINLNTCPELGLFLGYPMFAASNRLPEGGVNKTGIVPEIVIDENTEKPIQFILDFYKEKL